MTHVPQLAVRAWIDGQSDRALGAFSRLIPPYQPLDVGEGVVTSWMSGSYRRTRACPVTHGNGVASGAAISIGRDGKRSANADALAVGLADIVVPRRLKRRDVGFDFREEHAQGADSPFGVVPHEDLIV